MEHFGGAQGRAGIADEGMRHRPHAFLLAEIMRGRRRGAADEPDRVGDLLGVCRTNGSRVGHHFGHLAAGAVARVHREERDLRQIGAHGRRIVSGNASRSELLQQHGFEIDEVVERAGYVEDRLAGADPGGLRVVQLDVEFCAACRGGLLQKLDREARRADDRAAHEHGIARLAVAKPADNLLRLQEIAVGARREVAETLCRAVRHDRLTRPRRAGWKRSCHSVPRWTPFAARASAPRRSRKRVRAPGWH